MFNKLFIALMGVIFSLVMGGLSFAMMCGSGAGHNDKHQMVQAHNEHEHETNKASKQASPQESKNVGNKICPVSGQIISQVLESGMEPVTYEHEGKIYNFCCTDCVKEFKKEPQKYIKKVEKELQAEKDAAKEAGEEHKEHDMEMMPEHETSGHEGHSGHHH